MTLEQIEKALSSAVENANTGNMWASAGGVEGAALAHHAQTADALLVLAGVAYRREVRAQERRDQRDEWRRARLATMPDPAGSDRPAGDAVLILALERLARLGNGDKWGNSEGNTIAQEALAAHAENIRQTLRIRIETARALLAACNTAALAMDKGHPARLELSDAAQHLSADIAGLNS